MQWSKAGRSDSTLVVAVSNSELLTKGPQWCFWQCDRASWRVWSSPVHLPEWTGMYLGIFVHSLNEHFSIGANIKNISMQFFVIIPIFFFQCIVTGPIKFTLYKSTDCHYLYICGTHAAFQQGIPTISLISLVLPWSLLVPNKLAG